MALLKSNAPIAVLLLSLYAAVALYPAAAYGPFPASNASIAEPPFSSASAPAPAPYPAAASPSTAEAPFSAAPAPTSAETLFTVGAPSMAPVDEQAMDSRYLTVLMTAAAHKVEQFLAEEVEPRIQEQAEADSGNECLSICKEVYENAVDSMRSGVESVGAGDFVKASFDVGAFNTDVATCKECGAGGFEKLDQWAKGVAGDCLDRIVKYTNQI